MDEELSNPSAVHEEETVLHPGVGYRNGTNGANGAHQPVEYPLVPPLPEPIAPAQPEQVMASPASDSMYWQQNMAGQGREILWYNPPLPTSQGRRGELAEMVRSLAGTLGERSQRGWFLNWTFQSRAAAAQEESETLERDSRNFLKTETERAEPEKRRLDADIARLVEERKGLEKSLEAQQEDFAEIAGRAGLVPETGAVSIQRIEAALQRQMPSLERIAGQHGVSPAHRDTGLGKVITSALFGFLAPLVSGFMLALCLGTLVGLVDMKALKRPELHLSDYYPFILSAVLGFVIVYLMGELYYTAIHALTRALEERDEARRPGSLPSRYRAALGVAMTLLVGAVVLGCSEIAAEAMGLRALHLARIADLEIRGVTEHELPGLLYALIGLLISGPYLLYKSAKAWNHHDLHLRHSWLLHQQEEWMRERRGQEAVQSAFRQAHILEQTTAHLELVKTREEEARTRRNALQTITLPPDMRVRLDEARGAAVGEAARLHQMIEQIVDAHEPQATAPPGRSLHR